MDPQYLGNKELLNKKVTAFFASRTIATNKVMACYDWATSLNAEKDCVVSGFQSPIERDVLHFLLKKKIPIVVVLARTLYKHIPDELKEAYNDNRLLFISISNNERNGKIVARQRNFYVGDIANNIVFGMLPVGSSLTDIYNKLNEKGKLITVL